MSNYIVKIVWYSPYGEVLRQTNLNLRNVVITDMGSLKEAINHQFTERDKFEPTSLMRKHNQLIDMLCKVDDSTGDHLGAGHQMKSLNPKYPDNVLLTYASNFAVPSVTAGEAYVEAIKKLELWRDNAVAVAVACEQSALFSAMCHLKIKFNPLEILRVRKELDVDASTGSGVRL